MTFLHHRLKTLAVPTRIASTINNRHHIVRADWFLADLTHKTDLVLALRGVKALLS